MKPSGDADDDQQHRVDRGQRNARRPLKAGRVE